MPVERFSDPDAARRALWTRADDPDLCARIRRLWARTRRLVPSAGPRGVRRFRSQEEAEQDRLAWTRARVRALREGRGSS